MSKTTKRTVSRLGMAVAATMLATSVNAATFLWDFQNQSTAGGGGWNPSASSFNDNAISGGSFTINVRAYYSATSAGTWSVGTFSDQGSAGLGMTHTGDPGGSPEHAIDSIGQRDIVVIDAGLGNTVDWTSILIGWGEDHSSSTGALLSSSRADIRMWTGNSLNTGTATLDGLAGAGFNTKLLGDVPVGTTTTLTGTPDFGPSRYLIVAGDVNDAFKLKQIGGVTGSPPSAPEPASMALLGLGLLGLGYARRRCSV